MIINISSVYKRYYIEYKHRENNFKIKNLNRKFTNTLILLSKLNEH